MEKGEATSEMCLPTVVTVVRQLKRLIKNNKQSSDRVIKSVFVASDNDHLLDYIDEALSRTNVKAFKFAENNPHVDLAIMGRANYFIGNCISSFSAFVKRERDVKGFPSNFWAFPPSSRKDGIKDEL